MPTGNTNCKQREGQTQIPGPSSSGKLDILARPTTSALSTSNDRCVRRLYAQRKRGKLA